MYIVRLSPVGSLKFAVTSFKILFHLLSQILLEILTLILILIFYLSEKYANVWRKVRKSEKTTEAVYLCFRIFVLSAKTNFNEHFSVARHRSNKSDKASSKLKPLKPLRKIKNMFGNLLPRVMVKNINKIA